MSNHTTTHALRRPLGHAAIVLAAGLGLSLSAGPAAHAGDGGPLGDATEVVGGAAGQVLDPVIQTVGSTVPQPVQQAVEPVVQPVVEPVVSEVDRTVEAVVHDADRNVEATVREVDHAVTSTVGVVEQAAAPVVRVVKPADRRAEEPPATPDDPADGSTSAPAAPQAPVVDSTTDSRTEGVSVRPAAEHVPAATQQPGREQRLSRPAARPLLADLAPRAVAALPVAPGVFRGVLHDDDRSRPDQRLWTLTNELMHMWAGKNPPGGVDAGLAGVEETSVRTPGGFDPLPPLLGLLLGFSAMVMARRGVGPRILARGVDPDGVRPSEC